MFTLIAHVYLDTYTVAILLFNGIVTLFIAAAFFFLCMRMHAHLVLEIVYTCMEKWNHVTSWLCLYFSHFHISAYIVLLLTFPIVVTIRDVYYAPIAVLMVHYKGQTVSIARLYQQ